MTEKLFDSFGEVNSEATGRAGFLGAISLTRQKLKAHTPGQKVARALEEIQATQPTLGDIAEGIETDLNQAATVHAESVTKTPDWEVDFDWEGNFPPRVPVRKGWYMSPEDEVSRTENNPLQSS